MRLFVILALLMLVASSVNAATFNFFTDKTAFDFETGGGTAIGFDGLSDGEVITNQFQGDGVVFEAGTAVGLSNFRFEDRIGFRDLSSGSNLIAAELNFEEQQSFFGVSFLGSATIELLVGDSVIFSRQFGVNNIAFGGVSILGGTFDKVRLFDEEVAPGAFDEIQFGVQQVPLPASFPMFIVAILAGTGLLRRRSRRMPGCWSASRYGSVRVS